MSTGTQMEEIGLVIGRVMQRLATLMANREIMETGLAPCFDNAPAKKSPTHGAPGEFTGRAADIALRRGDGRRANPTAMGDRLDTGHAPITTPDQTGQAEATNSGFDCAKRTLDVAGNSDKRVGVPIHPSNGGAVMVGQPDMRGAAPVIVIVEDHSTTSHRSAQSVASMTDSEKCEISARNAAPVTRDCTELCAACPAQASIERAWDNTDCEALLAKKSTSVRNVEC